MRSLKLQTLVGILFVMVFIGFLQPYASHGKEGPVTTITVNSTEDDFNDGKSKTCSDTTLPCTLRRAINQAYSLSSTMRPVEIRFNIPTTDQGYINTPAVPGAWKIELSGTTMHELRELYGSTIINGLSQPGGRKKGPKIIIDGQGDKNNGFILRQGNNSVRGVAMQNFKTHINISSDNNLVERSWFGLSDDGMHLSAGDDLTSEGGSGVVVNNVEGNTIRSNYFAGFFGASCAITGDNNVFTSNFVGARSDGTVPLPAQFDKHPCMKGAWVGGCGITVAGDNNRIGGSNKKLGNVFAGLFLDISATSTQPPAIKIYQSKGHIIQNNTIGLDGSRGVIGVCGRGLDLGSGPQNLNVSGNNLTETALSAIFMNSSSLNGNTLKGNIIKRDEQWPGPQGDNPAGEDAIAYGPMVPDALRELQPAVVTSIAGNTVKGASAEGSPCPNCSIELFLDDGDEVKEALGVMGKATANNDGEWTVKLKKPLKKSQGLRTMSTVPDTFTIPGLDQGTTSNISDLYQKP